MEEGLEPPSCKSVIARWRRHREAEEAAQAEEAGAAVAPGGFVVNQLLEVVQTDHTQSDVTIVDRWFRRPPGRPWPTVALLLSRIVLPKQPWLDHLRPNVVWPMQGIPRTIHLDNGAEFHS